MRKLKEQGKQQIQQRSTQQTPEFTKSQIQFSKKQSINIIAFPPSQNRNYRVYVLFLFRFLTVISLIYGFSFTKALPLKPEHFLFALSMRLFSQRCRIALILLIIINYSLYAYTKYTISKSLKQMQVYLQILQLTQQLSLHLSGFLIMFNLELNLFLMIITGTMSIICAVDLQNYIIRDDLMYQSSMFSGIFFYVLIIFTYLLNGVAVYLQDFDSSRLVTCMAGLMFAIWYFTSGYVLYIFRLTKTFLLIFICSFCSIGYISCESYFIIDTKFNQTNMLKIMLIACAMFLTFKVAEDKILQMKSMSILSPIDKIPTIELKMLIAKNNLQINRYQLIAIGLLKKYQEEGLIKYGKCYSNEKFLFDSLTETHLRSQQFMNSFDSYMKFIVKERYQCEEQQKSKIVDFKIKYCQFLLNELPNFTEILDTIAFIQRNPISFIQKKAIEKIKWYISESSNKLSSNLTETTLKLQCLISSQRLVEEIQNLLKQYIHKYLILWQLIEAKSENISSLKTIFSQTSIILTMLEERWAKLTTFLPYNHSWKELFIYYLLYIRNQQLHSKKIQQNTKDITNNQKIYSKPSWKNPTKFSSLFDSRSLVFHTIYRQQQLIFINVSKRFSFNLKWTKTEIIGANLSILIPQGMKGQHQIIFKRWYQNGHETSESSYKKIFTHCLDKNGNELPVEKSFKPFINYNLMDLQFVCLLTIKKNEDFDVKQPSVTNKSMAYNIGVPTKQQISKDTNIKIPIQKSIFLKEDIFNPTNELVEISKIKKAMRLYSIFMAISIMTLSLIDYSSSVFLNEYSEEYINFMQLYRYPVILGNDYYSKLLNIGDQTNIMKKIRTKTQKFRGFQISDKTMRTLFNKQLHKPQSYNIMNSNGVVVSTMNQIQLFFSITSAITSISDSSITVQKFNDQRLPDFFNMLRPSYDHMINSTKFQFHETFVKSLQTINNSIYLAIGVQAFILISMVIFSIYTVNIYFRRIKQIVRTILEFNPYNIETIKSFWVRTINIFEAYTAKNSYGDSQQELAYHQHRTSKYSDRILGKQIDQKDKHNTDSQNNYFQKQQKRFKIKIIALIFTTTFGIFLMLVITQKVYSLKFQQILYFQDDGFSFLKYFPTSALTCHGCLEKTFASIYPELYSFDVNNYVDILSNLWIVGNFQYVNTVKDPSSQYEKKKLNYFFGNPCTFNPEISQSLGMSIEKCQSVLESSLKRGLCGFMRTAYAYAEDCLYGAQIKSKQWLEEFSQGVMLLSAYLLDAIETWGKQFTNRINSTLKSFFKVTIFEMLFILCLHFVVFEQIVLKQIAQEYQFYKKFYINMVPQFVLQKDKIIKQKFLTSKIIVIK